MPAIYSQDPNIGIRAMGAAHLIPQGINSMTFEGNARMNAKRAGSYVTAPRASTTFKSKKKPATEAPVIEGITPGTFGPPSFLNQGSPYAPPLMAKKPAMTRKEAGPDYGSPSKKYGTVGMTPEVQASLNPQIQAEKPVMLSGYQPEQQFSMVPPTQSRLADRIIATQPKQANMNNAGASTARQAVAQSAMGGPQTTSQTFRPGPATKDVMSISNQLAAMYNQPGVNPDVQGPPSSLRGLVAEGPPSSLANSAVNRKDKPSKRFKGPKPKKKFL
jgi:hypothetical protein